MTVPPGTVMAAAGVEVSSQAGGLDGRPGNGPLEMDALAIDEVARSVVSPTTTSAAGALDGALAAGVATLDAGPSQLSGEKSELSDVCDFKGMGLRTVGTLVLQRLLEVCVSFPLRRQSGWW